MSGGGEVGERERLVHARFDEFAREADAFVGDDGWLRGAIEA